MTVDLNGKTAIVTGGAKGYGLGITEVLREKGMRVWMTGRDADALNREAERLGANAACADVTSGADWDRVFAAVMGTAGRVDVLINNAGAGINIGPLESQSDEDIEAGIAINLTGAILGCKRAAAIMRRQGAGTIVNVSSVCQRQAWPGFSVYSAAKAGMGQLSNCLYAELRDAGVRVTTVIPSWGATGFREAAGMGKRDAETDHKCIQPRELGELVATVCELPAHLEIQDLTLWPLVQQVEPL